MSPLRIAFNLNNRAVVQLRDGVFTGPAAEVAHHIARAVGDVTLKGYPDARSVVGEVESGWDIAFLAVDPKRADRMHFSTPYMQVHATLLLRVVRPETTFAEYLEMGEPILSVPGAAYHEHLARRVPASRLVLCDSVDAARRCFDEGCAPALAGLRIGLAGMNSPGAHCLCDDFATIPQAVALAPVAQPLLGTVEMAIREATSPSSTATHGGSGHVR